MATRSEQTARGPVRDFHSLFRRAQRAVIDGANDLREVRLNLEGPHEAHSRGVGA
jgi:hypothetical protein